MAAYFYGEILYQQKKRPEANAAWQAAAKSAAAAVKADPTDATAQFYLGASLVRAKRFEEARTALRLAVRGGFDEPMVNHQIGLSYLFAEKWKEAKDAFDLGLSVDPRYAPMYFLPGDGVGQAGPQGQHADRLRSVRQAGTERTRCGFREVGSQELGTLEARCSGCRCSMLDAGSDSASRRTIGLMPTIERPGSERI